MTDASQEQTERQMQQQQKWHKFADQLRHSTDHNNERVYDETRPPLADSSSNGLKSPVSDEQQSDLGTDQTVDESSSGVAEEGFELVINKRNRNQRPKPMNGNVWSGAATHLKELHSTSSSSSTTAHSGNSSTQSKLRVASANNTASKHTVQNRNLTTKNTQCLRSTEDGAPDIEQDTSNSSDSAFAENQSPHGSSASLHFMASENQNFSDSVALSDDEKWPELNAQPPKPAASPTLPKETETKSTTPVEDKSNSLDKDAAGSNRRAKPAQWKKMDVDIVYTKPNEKKHGSSKRNVRSHGNSEYSGHRHSVGSSYNKQRRPQSRKSNVSSSDVESQNNNESKKPETKSESNEVSENNKSESHRHAQPVENSHQYQRRDNKYNEQNNRNHRNNNNHRQDQQPHYNDRRQPPRNQRVRHSVPNLFQCQSGIPVYFLSQDYAPENFVQPLNAAAAPPFIYPNVGNVLMPAGYPDIGYANAQFLNEYGQQNLFQYRAPFVQMPVLSQNSPFVSTSIPTTIPESVAEQNSSDQHNNMPEQSLEEELSHLLRRVFLDDENRSLRDLTENLNIISQLNYPERCLILRCQMQFYFSPDNIVKDVFLRNHMDENGYVNLGLFLNFPRIKNLALDSNTIVSSLATCPNFELKINEEEVKIRAKTLPQEWISTSNANISTPSTTVPSPQTDSTVSQTKRPSQPAEDITVDDVRARLIQNRSKHSPASSEHHSEPTPKSETPESQPGEEVEDQWMTRKKKTRQPSANGSVHHEEMNSKPPTGKQQRTRQ